MTSRADSWGWKMEVLINTQINYRNGTLSWRSTVYLIEEEKMGGTTKIWLWMLSFTEEKYHYFAANQSLTLLLLIVNLAIILGTILIDSNWLV